MTNRKQVAGDFFDNTRFTVDWDEHTATCPGSRTNAYWSATRSHWGTPVTRARFFPRDCDPGELRANCTNSRHGRSLTFRP
ncbi:hypothetical protein ACFU93_45685 [Streptomyces sp. NPDC057611]|uniref:hypothetical protein n=1 Tax=Streptomyces sp. NPDC057611 TaxID=3346182 RepID=UPI0036B98C90